MSLDWINPSLIRAGIFVFLLTWVVLNTRRRYASKLSWKDSVLMVLATVLLTILAMTLVSIVLTVVLQRWVNKEAMETIVLVVILIVMYVVFKYLQRHLEARFLKGNPSNDD